jgi:hypothetical protein
MRKRLKGYALGTILFFIVFLPVSLNANDLEVYVIGDCEKITKDGEIPESPHFWDSNKKLITLHGGRNEVLGFQIMLVAKKNVKGVNIEISDLKNEDDIIKSNPNVELFYEFYQFVDSGAYTWGPPSIVLEDNKYYPDPLIPFNDPYDNSHKPVAAPFDIDISNGTNQGIWVDIYIPKGKHPGVYNGTVDITVEGKKVNSIGISLTVHKFTLPDEFHVDGYGEMYGFAKWDIFKRYYQMAHQHRFVVAERQEWAPKDWKRYDEKYEGILNGKLFTKEENYYGPGEGVGVPFWIVPFPQDNFGGVRKLTDKDINKIYENAKNIWEHFKSKGWDKKRLFAYIYDEVPTSPLALECFSKVQDAIDKATGGKNIHLIWTSHTDPSTVFGLGNIIRWWAPNGTACNPDFLSPKALEGQTVWFYHAGHPAIGVHCVNASGIELRTWSNICWRYKINGSFWWAVDFWSKDPLRRAQYKSGEDRWGNGILFYPGNKLSTIGFSNINGPLSSLRMKAYRRGHQDYEYCYLLKNYGKGSIADKIIKEVIPSALTKAKGTREWSTDENKWYEMRKKLAEELNNIPEVK